MSDRRAAIAFFFEGAPPPAPTEFAGARVVSSRALQHPGVGVLVLLHHLHPLVDDVDALAAPLDALASRLGAKVAIVDRLFNLNVVPAWASEDWPESWQISGVDLYAFFRDLPFWELGWVRRDVWDESTDMMRELVLEGATRSEETHGVVLRHR